MAHSVGAALMLVQGRASRGKEQQYRAAKQRQRAVRVSPPRDHCPLSHNSSIQLTIFDGRKRALVALIAQKETAQARPSLSVYFCLVLTAAGQNPRSRLLFNPPAICRTITGSGLLEVRVAEQDRRRTPRYSFVASAEIVAEHSDVRVAASVTELSLHGCYLDMTNPFPLSTPVTIKISAADQVFESKGRVIYLHPGIGAGVTFLEVAPLSRALLKSWLDAAEKNTRPGPD
jgi:hypothetical protein